MLLEVQWPRDSYAFLFAKGNSFAPFIDKRQLRSSCNQEIASLRSLFLRVARVENTKTPSAFRQLVLFPPVRLKKQAFYASCRKQNTRAMRGCFCVYS
jgi:hypothetical protein